MSESDHYGRREGDAEDFGTTNLRDLAALARKHGLRVNSGYRSPNSYHGHFDHDHRAPSYSLRESIEAAKRYLEDRYGDPACMHKTPPGIVCPWCDE